MKHWFDTREGKLVVGEAAYEQVVEQSGPGDLVPLVDILTATSFEVDTSHIEKPDKTRSYTYDDALIHGKWVLNILAQADEPPQLKNHHFDRVSRLGLGMGIEAIRRQLGEKIWQISQVLGAERNYSPFGSFDSWGSSEFIQNAQELAMTMGRRRNPKPRKKDYEEWARQGNGPSPAIIEAKTGYSIRQLNELIGFFNSRERDPEKILNWGVNVMTANEGAIPTKHIMSILSRRKRGPGNTLIRTHFGSLRNFQAEISERYSAHRASLTLRAKSATETYTDSFHGHGRDFVWPEDPEAQLGLVGRYRVAARLLSEDADVRALRIAAATNHQNFIKNLQGDIPFLTAGEVEVTALELDCFDDIWPSHIWSEKHLRVTDKQLSEERERAANYQRLQRAKQTIP